MSTGTNKRKELIRLAAAAGAALTGLTVPLLTLSAVVNPRIFPLVNDLPQYYAGATLALSGQGALAYDLAQLIREEHRLFPLMGDRAVGLFIPPFGLLLLLPVALIPVDSAPIVWTSLLAACALAACILIKRTFQLSLSGLFWLVSLLCLSGPFFEALRIGQLAPLLLLSHAAGLQFLKNRRNFSAGLSWSLLLLKPQELLPLVVYLAAGRKWTTVAAILTVTVTLTVVSLIVCGVESWRNYIALIANQALNTTYMQPQLSSTVRGQLLRFSELSPELVKFAGTGVLIAGLSAIAAAGKRSGGSLEGLLFIAMPAGLVTSLHCHDYDLILLVPSLVALVKSSMARAIPLLVRITACACGTVFMLPLYLEIHYNYLLKGALINPQFIVLFVWSILLSIFVWKRLPADSAADNSPVREN